MFDSKEVLTLEAEAALEEFKQQPYGKELVEKSVGVLVFPSVVKAGIGFGGEYGEGALLMDKKWDYFYNLISVSWGWQLGVQVKTIVMMFMNKDALKDFNKTMGWKVGVDASVAVITLDAGINIDTNTLTSPVVACVTDRKGLMYSASLEGTKITRINK